MIAGMSSENHFLKTYLDFNYCLIFKLRLSLNEWLSLTFLFYSTFITIFILNGLFIRGKMSRYLNYDTVLADSSLELRQNILFL